MLINGERTTTIAISDRGLAYGDGLFETIRYAAGRLLFAEAHLQRLEHGCKRLGIVFDAGVLKREIALALTRRTTDDGILKLIVTRGAGGRGYRPGSEHSSTRIITLHPLPDYSPLYSTDGIAAFVCQQRLAAQPALAGIKHLNRLEQVLASLEWPDDDVQEGLMLDTDGHVVEGTRSNIFFATEGVLHTPALAGCGVAGIMREVLLQHFATRVVSGQYDLSQLVDADEVFICNSVIGIWPVITLKSGSMTYQWRKGPFAEEAASVFSGALPT